jgi:hypothetical protein
LWQLVLRPVVVVDLEKAVEVEVAVGLAAVAGSVRLATTECSITKL